MGHGPDVQADKLDRRPLLLWKLTAQSGGRALQDIEGALGCGRALAFRARRQTCLEHDRVARRLLAGEGEIGAAEILDGRERRGHAIVPGRVELGGEALEAVAGDLGEKRIAIAEMAIGCGWADAG